MLNIIKRSNFSKFSCSSYYRKISFHLTLLNGIKVQIFFGKKNWKKHLCCHDKNYYYFWKSNIPVINLIVDSRNMIKVSKICVCKKLDKQQESFSPNTNNFLVFLLFLNGKEIWKVQWINRKWNVMQNYVVINFLWTFPY